MRLREYFGRFSMPLTVQTGALIIASTIVQLNGAAHFNFYALGNRRFSIGGDIMAKPFAKPFYHSPMWIKTRNAYVAERTAIDGGMCEECRENVGEELHHIVPLTPININDFDVALNWDNLKYLCKDCHFKAHREIILAEFEKRRKARKPILTNGCYMDDEGFIQKMGCYIVWGAPASGKTSYVKQNMQSGDLVVNLNNIKEALTLGNIGNSDNLLPVAFSVRDLLYGLIKQRTVDCKNAWVIATLPRRAEREQLAAELDAELVYMDADYHECIKQAAYGCTGTSALELKRAMIDKFFEALER